MECTLPLSCRKLIQYYYSSPPAALAGKSSSVKRDYLSNQSFLAGERIIFLAAGRVVWMSDLMMRVVLWLATHFSGKDPFLFEILGCSVLATWRRIGNSCQPLKGVEEMIRVKTPDS
ncbi:hypothetical protein AVEN_158722-1 [Araneus ventricosus]|uniref:Uncharacterized protein n=1 Tax=Araneus ventricosus TaxID=182803 RepID=A0A4Y2WE52_ARAVE|nr:hypothetical protein AVEN_158722-1 [Araneus ventricosus]